MILCARLGNVEHRIGILVIQFLVWIKARTPESTLLGSSDALGSSEPLHPRKRILDICIRDAVKNQAVVKAVECIACFIQDVDVGQRASESILVFRADVRVVEY